MTGERECLRGVEPLVGRRSLSVSSRFGDAARLAFEQRGSCRYNSIWIGSREHLDPEVPAVPGDAALSDSFELIHRVEDRRDGETTSEAFDCTTTV